MRRYIPFLAALLTATGAGLARSAGPSLPSTLRYSFYAGGKPAGGEEIRISRTRSALIFESRTHVALPGGTIDLTCRTEADPETFAVRRFSYQGTRGGNAIAGEIQVTPDSVFQTLRSDPSRVHRKMGVKGRQILVFEDWVVELQALLALRQERLASSSTTYTFLFASAFAPADALAGFTGDILIEANGRSLVARKLAVAVQGSQPFESQVDPERHVPVYLRFPAAGAEIFLDDFFGANPPTRLAPKAAPRAQGGG